MTRRLTLLAAATTVALSTTSCLNVFSPVDQPAGDTQLISAARAALDRGDFATALADYQKLSTSSQETAISEQAFAILDQQGIGMDAFLNFMGNASNSGLALTQMSEKISNAGTTKRSAIYKAFLLSNVNGTYGARTQLQYFTQFMTSLALSAELLAEVRGSSSLLYKTAITSAPSSCNGTSCLVAGCSSSGSTLGTTAASDIATTEPTASTPASDMLFYSINYAFAALNSLGSGNLSGTSSGFQSIVGVGKPSSATAIDQCFRYQVLNFGIGRN